MRIELLVYYNVIGNVCCRSSKYVKCIPRLCCELALRFTRREASVVEMDAAPAAAVDSRCNVQIAWQYIFSRPLPRYVRLMAWAVRLSSVCRLWRCCITGRDLNFSAIILHRLIAQGLGQSVLKFWAKIRRGSRGSCNKKGMKNWRFLTNISHFFKTCTRYGHSLSGRPMGTRMRYI